MRVARCIPALLWCLAVDALADYGSVSSSEISTESGLVLAADVNVVNRAPLVPAEAASPLSIDKWQRVGKARLRVLFWDIYDSELHTPNGEWQGQGPYQLSLHYLRDITVNQLIEQTDKAWREQGRNHPMQAEWLVRLADIWPDITEGDNLVLSVAASGHSGFWFNGEFIGAIPDVDFGPLFGGIWLDPDTPQPALRSQLISGASGSR